MSDVTRRTFLSRGATAAAAGAVLATTGLRARGSATTASGSSTDTPDAAADTAAVASVGGPLVVHIRDTKTGEMSIFSGETEVAYRDPQLVARVARATRRNQV